MSIAEERRMFLEEARCRLAAIEQLQAGRLTTGDVPEPDATWATAALARKVSMFVQAADDLEALALKERDERERGNYEH